MVDAARAEDVVVVEASLVGDAANRSLADDRHHPVDVVRGEAPVALGLQVAERQRSPLAARAEPGYVVDDLAREKLRPAAAGLVVEEDSARDPQVVGLAIALAEQVRSGLRGGVGALRLSTDSSL